MKVILYPNCKKKKEKMAILHDFKVNGYNYIASSGDYFLWNLGEKILGSINIKCVFIWMRNEVMCNENMAIAKIRICYR